MLFARVVAFFAAFFTLGMFAFATPLDVSKRDSPTLADSLDDLRNNVDAVIVEINAQIAVGITADLLEPLVGDIEALIDAHVVLVATIDVLGDSQEGCAQRAADILADINVSLQAVVDVDGNFIDITADVGVHLNTWLSALNGCSSGILNLIVNLCVSLNLNLNVLGLVGGLLAILLGLLGGIL